MSNLHVTNLFEHVAQTNIVIAERLQRLKVFVDGIGKIFDRLKHVFADFAAHNFLFFLRLFFSFSSGAKIEVDVGRGRDSACRTRA